MWTGFAIPRRTGPMTSAPPSMSRSLYEEFAADSREKTRTLAGHFKREKG